MGTVMQRQPHKTLTAPRFFVSTRGVLMDRQATGTARRTGYSMAGNNATRSEMQILAALFNTADAAQLLDTGWSPEEAWAAAIDRHRAGQRRTLPMMQEDCCAE